MTCKIALKKVLYSCSMMVGKDTTMKAPATLSCFSLTTVLALTLTAPANCQAQVTNGLTAYYPLAKDGTDASGHGLDMTYSNVTFAYNAPWNTNPAALFNGTNSVCVGQPLISTLTNWSWSAWLYPIQPPEFSVIYAEGLTGGSVFEINLQDGILHIGTANGSWIDNSAPITLNQWGHVVFTMVNAGFRSGNLAMFLNGSLVKIFGAQQVSPQPSMSALGNGWRNSSLTFTNAPYDGGINNLRFYNRALSAIEVQQLYAFEAAPRILTQPQGQVGYWGMNASFQVRAGSPLPVTYQWAKDSFPIPWATNSTFTLTNLNFSDAGNYSVSISNAVAGVTSVDASLIVNPAGVTLGLYPGLTIQGVVGRTYGIEFTTSVSNSNQWTTLTTMTLTNPVELFTDTNADASLPSNPQRFYRVVPIP